MIIMTLLPSNKFIQSNISQVPISTMVAEYNLIAEKKSKLTYSQRVIIIRTVNEYIKYGKVKMNAE